MSSNIPKAQQVGKLNPTAAVFLPKETDHTTEEKVDNTRTVDTEQIDAIEEDDSSIEASSELDRDSEISSEAIVVRFSKMCGESYWDIDGEEDWMDAIIEQDLQIAKDSIRKTSFALDLKEASILPVEACNVTDGVEDTAVGGNCFDKFPIEIQKGIFKLALTADHGVISMQCLSNKTFKPNVATGLLRTCKKIYHQARDYLYNENIVIFDQFGSDLKALTNPLGLRSCHVAGCSMAFERPKFANVIFDIGEAAVDWQGCYRTAMFTYAMKGMRCKIDVDHLRIELRAFCFADNIKPEDFAEGLENINVIKSMTICGNDHHWELGNLRAIPQGLRMNKQPISTAFYPRNDSLQPPRPGVFSSTYVPAKDVMEITAVPGEQFLDVGDQYQEWCRVYWL